MRRSRKSACLTGRRKLSYWKGKATPNTGIKGGSHGGLLSLEKKKKKKASLVTRRVPPEGKTGGQPPSDKRRSGQKLFIGGEKKR